MPALGGHAIRQLKYESRQPDWGESPKSELKQRDGVRCWFAPHDMSPGRNIHEQIDEAIRLHDKLLLILSSHSMNSEWVKTEIRKRELTENRRMLFPSASHPWPKKLKRNPPNNINKSLQPPF